MAQSLHQELTEWRGQGPGLEKGQEREGCGEEGFYFSVQVEGL
jgi:hypothetical protein